MSEQQNKPETAGGQSALSGLVMRYGGPRQIPHADVRCPMDEFENHIRDIGVIATCEWFGHSADSEFTEETVRVLLERSNDGGFGDGVTWSNLHQHV